MGHGFTLCNNQKEPDRRATRPAGNRAWRRGDPRLHACGYSGNSKGDAAQRFERDGLPDFAWQYLSSLSPPGRGADSRIGRAASLHELGWTDFNRQRRLPSLQPRQRCESYRKREFAFNLIWMALIISLPQRTSFRFKRPSEATSPWCWTNVSPMTRTGSMFGIPRRERFAGLNVVCRARSKADQLMFGIIQGGMYKDLREQCVREMNSMPFDGFAVGGLGVGEGEELLHSIAASTAGLLPEDSATLSHGCGQTRGYCAMPSAPVLICSIVFCRRATLETARSLQRKANSASSAPNSPVIRGRWMRPATATAVATFRGPTCAICTSPEKSFHPS